MHKARLALLIFLLSANISRAQSQLTLDDCLRLATSAKSPVDVARQQLAGLHQGVREATADFLPQSRLVNVYTYNSPLQGTQDQFSFISLNGIRQFTSQYTAAQELDFSGRLRAGLARARAGEQAGSARVRIAERDLKLAVRQAYYEVLRTQHQLAALQQALIEAETFERRAIAMEKGGEVSKSDVARARVQVAIAAQEVHGASLELRAAEHALLSFWTTDMEARPTLDDLFTKPLPVPDDLSGPGSYSNRPEFSFFNAARLGFKAEAKQARANLLPQPSLVFQYGIDSLRWTGHDRGYAAFVNLNIPVFDWGKALAAQKRANLQADQVETEKTVAERGFARDLATGRAALRARYDQVRSAGDEVANATELLRLAKLRYEGGVTSALEVVDAQNALAHAQLNYYTAIRDYFMARAETEVASGR